MQKIHPHFERNQILTQKNHFYILGIFKKEVIYILLFETKALQTSGLNMSFCIFYKENQRTAWAFESNRT